MASKRVWKPSQARMWVDFREKLLLNDPKEKFTAEDVVKMVKWVINKRGKDYVSPVCVNTVYDLDNLDNLDTQPGCVVGYVFAELLGDVNQVPHSGAVQHTLSRTHTAHRFTQDAIKVLSTAQHTQDERVEYGKLLDNIEVKNGKVRSKY